MNHHSGPENHRHAHSEAAAQFEHFIDMKELAADRDPLVVPVDIHGLPKHGADVLVADILDGREQSDANAPVQTLPDPERTRDEHRTGSRFSPRTEAAIEERLWAIFRVFDGLDEQGRQAAIKAYFMGQRDRGRDGGEFADNYLNDD